MCRNCWDSSFRSWPAWDAGKKRRSISVILERTGNLPLFREAAVEFYRLRGDLRRSIEHAEGWVREVPRHMPARYALVDLIGKRDGAWRALEQASRWLAETSWP